MLLFLFFMFTAVPAFELYLLITVGQKIGALETIWIVIITGVVGASFARSQGRQIFARVQQQLQAGQLPADAGLQGLMVFAGGLLLITPGFVTDAVGLSLVFPLTRKLIIILVKRWLERSIKSGRFRVQTMNYGGQGFEFRQGPMQDVTPEEDRPAIKDVTPKD